jgi:hypothetical protein
MDLAEIPPKGFGNNPQGCSVLYHDDQCNGTGAWKLSLQLLTIRAIQ